MRNPQCSRENTEGDEAMMIQQGDILIERIEESPSKCKPHLNNHLAEGEATGHCHAAVGEDVQVLVAPDGQLDNLPTHLV